MKLVNQSDAMKQTVGGSVCKMSQDHQDFTVFCFKLVLLQTAMCIAGRRDFGAVEVLKGR